MPISARSLENYQVEIQTGTHTFISDEPVGIGDGAGPEPFQLLLSALGSCTIITLQMYARRKQWPLEGVEADLDIASVQVVNSDGSKTRKSQILINLTVHGSLTPEQISRIEEIAARCPVHRTLLGNMSIQTNVGNKP